MERAREPQGRFHRRGSYWIARKTDLFSERVSDSFMRALSENSDNPIFELELLPVLASYMIWEEWIKHFQLVIYIDNGAKDVLQAATGGHVRVPSRRECTGHKAWFSRVPSFSNLT